MQEEIRMKKGEILTYFLIVKAFAYFWDFEFTWKENKHSPFIWFVFF